MIPTKRYIMHGLGLFSIAGFCLSGLTKTSACAEANKAHTIATPTVSPANPLAGPGNAITARIKRMSPKNDGLYIPVPKGSNVTFGYISKEPVTLLGGAVVLDQSGNVTDERPVLKTVGRVLLQNGLLIGRECSEHLRLNDAIRNGAIQNVGHRTIDLPLSDGAIVRLRPGDGVFINDDEPLQKSRSAAFANFKFECQCTCTDGTHKDDANFDCPYPCEQSVCSGQNGSDCTTTVNTDGKLQDCARRAVPIPSINPAPLP